MRPIKLKMKAFGPYVNCNSIDFEKELRDEKIFLIHGATGSGKTTILDAISYALYGETSGKDRDVKDMRSKSVADNVSTEVEFIFALGHKKFKVHREIIYSPNRKEENRYEKRAELFCDGNLLATGETAVKNRVIELLGFKAEQFRQVVILPQGEFKKFLSADAKGKQEVLNVLFDSSIYKKIEDMLAERAKVSNSEVQGLETRCKTLEEQLKGTDSSSLDEVEEKISAAQEELDKLKKSLDEAQSALTNGTVLASRFADLDIAREEFKSAEIKFTEEKKTFETAKSEYEARKAEESKRNQLEEWIRELKNIKSTLEDLKKKNETLESKEKELEEAERKFNDCDKKHERYENRMNQLKAEKSRLECEEILGDISKLETDLKEARDKVQIFEQDLDTAQIELTRLQIVNNAAHLAIHLKDGEPCPVCGSIEHPAIISKAIPTVAELRAANDKVNRLMNEKNQFEKKAAQINGGLSVKKSQLAKYEDDLINEAKKNFVDIQTTHTKLEKCKQNITNGNKYIEQNKIDSETVEKNKNIIKSAVERLKGEISEAEKKITKVYSTNSEQVDLDLSAAEKEFKQLNSAWKTADENYRTAEKNKSKIEGQLKTIEKHCDVLKRELKGKTQPDIESLEQKEEESRKNYVAALSEKAKLETIRYNLQKYSSKLEKVKSELTKKQKIADMWQRLSDVANATGKGESELKISFQRYFLSTMFNEVVSEANNRLEKMSGGRYLFKMKDKGKTTAKSAGLNLEIFDEYSGKTRPVETLSGGESFLASLSLALGLAAVVQNNSGGIKLETIFIDEGFGTLDSETLDFAMKTLTELQSDGRLVGIISHVEELKNQMPVRLEVYKTKTGSFAKFES